VDFVVVGLGVGALAILLGLTSREAGPRRWPLRRDQPLAPAEQARRLAIGRAGRAGGLVLCLAGGAIVVATIIALGLNLSDQAGAILVMVTISVTVFAGVAWGALYVARYHPRPLPRTPGRRVAPSWTDEASSLPGTIDTAIDQRGIWPNASDAGASEPEAPVAAEPPAEAEPVSSEADVPDGDESGVAAEPSPVTSEQPTVEPAVNGEALPRPQGFAISGKNQSI
jgi:hypothetical protein